MLRPFGQGKYFGISTDEFPDASLVPDIPPHVPATPPSECLETLLPDRENGVPVAGCVVEECIELHGDDEDEIYLLNNKVKGVYTYKVNSLIKIAWVA